MEADDLVNLVAGGSRGGSKRFLRPLLKGITGHLFGDNEDAVDAVNSRQGNRRAAGNSILSGGLINSVRKFLPSRVRNETGFGEAEEVREEADNESLATDDANGCCQSMIGGYKVHILLFLFTFALSLNWSATGYAIARKVCIAQNASESHRTTVEEFCQRWLHPNNSSQSEPHSINDLFNAIFDNEAALRQQILTSTNSSTAIRLNSNVLVANPLSRNHRRRGRGSQAEQTTELYIIYQSIVALVPPALAMIFVVLSYRDEFSNFRTPLFIGMFGTALSTAANLVSSMFPIAPLYYDILTPLGEAFTGGLPLIMMCIYVQIAATVPPKGRTTAFFLLQVSFLLSFSIARLVSALVVDSSTETLGLLIASIVVLFITFVYVFVVINHVDLTTDSNETGRHRRHSPNRTSTNDPVLLSTRLFSHHHLLHSVRGLVHAEAQGTKYELLFVMATVFFLVATTNGSVAGYLLENTTQRGVVLDSVIVISTVLIVLPIFVLIVRKLPFDPNYTVTFIGVFFLTAGQSLHLASMGGGQNSAAINHIQHVLRTLSNLAPAGMRAHVATLVERPRFGKVFGAVAACEAVAPLIGTAMRRIIGRGFGQLPLLLLLWGPLLMLGIGQCRRRRPQVATAAVDEDE